SSGVFRSSITAGSSTATVRTSCSWAASTARAPCRVAAALVTSSGNSAWSQTTGCPRRSAKLGTTAGAPVRRCASSRRSRVATRTCGRSTGHATMPEGRVASRAARAARSDPIAPPARSGISTMMHSWVAREGRMRAASGPNPKSAATRLVADDLRDSLAVARKKYKMGRALAAPQIGAPVRIVFVQTDKQRWTMINPEITDVGPDDFLVWDDCFSFPNLLVRVNRAYQVTVTYTDPKGKP